MFVYYGQLGEAGFHQMFSRYHLWSKIGLEQLLSGSNKLLSCLQTPQIGPLAPKYCVGWLGVDVLEQHAAAPSC